MPANSKPNRLKLRTYQVGFGDCFLLTFAYPAQAGHAAFERHVLIDCGSTGAPKTFGGDLIQRVAGDIKAVCQGKLHIVVATHRHKDHISGFATQQNGKGPGDILRSCKPDLVLQPWTEDPDAKPDATKPTKELPGGQAFVRSLASMQSFAGALRDEVQRLGPRLGKRMSEQLSFLGEDNLANLPAVQNLMTMGKESKYLYYGCKLDVSDLLPGVKVHVLGPPTLEQSKDIRQERAKDQAEFWHFQAVAGRQFTSGGRRLFPRAAVLDTLPAYTSWLVPRLRAIRGEQMLELVRILDDAMNNTSLILLFEVGGKKFLFPGDAQIEDWSYALQQAADKPALRQLLADVSLYKVGHHGSLNATPKSLWRMFKRRDTHQRAGRLQSVVSTMAGKHGSRDRDTEVPREKLVEALEAETDFFSTQDLKKKAELFKEFAVQL